MKKIKYTNVKLPFEYSNDFKVWGPTKAAHCCLTLMTRQILLTLCHMNVHRQPPPPPPQEKKTNKKNESTCLKVIFAEVHSQIMKVIFTNTFLKVVTRAAKMFEEVRQFARLLPQFRSLVQMSEIWTLQNVQKSPTSHIPMDPIFAHL